MFCSVFMCLRREVNCRREGGVEAQRRIFSAVQAVECKGGAIAANKASVHWQDDTCIRYGVSVLNSHVVRSIDGF